MITREGVEHRYHPVPAPFTITNGVVKIKTVNGVVQTWAVTRPGTAPPPAGAPFYIAGYASPPNVLYGGGTMPLKLRQDRIQMDPSNPATWQREYRFT